MVFVVGGSCISLGFVDGFVSVTEYLKVACAKKGLIQLPVSELTLKARAAPTAELPHGGWRHL